MGAGNVAATHKRQAERQLTQAEQARMFNQIRREVASALALTEARRQQVDFAAERLAIAEAAFREDYTRIRAKIGLPIEVLDNMRRLVDSRLSFVATLASYNQAQFQLFVAVGQTPLAADAAVNPNGEPREPNDPPATQ
jgi:outer membrane protein TolC